MSKDVKLAPSILAADFARLGEHVQQAERGGADRIHVDVMDGHFVPNISIGPLVVEALKPVTKLPLETHLMITDPDFYIDDFVKAGSSTIIVHVEGNPHLNRTIQKIKGHGIKAGVVFNPATPVSAIGEVLADVDLVLVMTVNPGFGGQKFIDGTLSKIRQVRAMIDKDHPGCDLEVDGGIDATTAPKAVEAGANVLVAGSAIFSASEGVQAAMDKIRQATS